MLVLIVTASALVAGANAALPPWTTSTHPTDQAKSHVEEIATNPHQYQVFQGGTMDGRNCRSPMGCGIAREGALLQSWDSNRSVRMENMGETDVVNPWQAEWDVLLSAIRNDRPHNEARRAALSNLGAIMGRAAVHTGRVVTWEEAMASSFQFCSKVDSLTASSPAPVQANAEGRYPAPVPGAWTEI
jgi:hypothetical protein